MKFIIKLLLFMALTVHLFGDDAWAKRMESQDTTLLEAVKEYRTKYNIRDAQIPAWKAQILEDANNKILNILVLKKMRSMPLEKMKNQTFELASWLGYEDSAVKTAVNLTNLAIKFSPEPPTIVITTSSYKDDLLKVAVILSILIGSLIIAVSLRWRTK